jgi:hypothetical protein
MSDDDALTPTSVVPTCSRGAVRHYEGVGELSRFKYYVARDYKKRGRPCIRVVRSHLLQEGKHQSALLLVFFTEQVRCQEHIFTRGRKKCPERYTLCNTFGVSESLR